jgi:hypothetical protein
MYAQGIRFLVCYFTFCKATKYEIIHIITLLYTLERICTSYYFLYNKKVICIFDFWYLLLLLLIQYIRDKEYVFYLIKLIINL